MTIMATVDYDVLYTWCISTVCLWYPAAAHHRAIGCEPGQLTPLTDVRLVKQDPRHGTYPMPFGGQRTEEESVGVGVDV